MSGESSGPPHNSHGGLWVLWAAWSKEEGRPGVDLQRTIKSSISCVGVGLHSGRRVSATLHPADLHHGIALRRIDLRATIPARFDQVSDIRLATTIGLGGARVSTIEHLMAALSAAGVDNVLVDLDGPEPPILDGSAAPWLFLIDCAGIALQQGAPRHWIEVLRPVRVQDGAGWAELAPAASYDGLELEVSIDFAAAAIGCETLTMRLEPETFRHQVARARTFALAQDVDALREAGLAQGGSLENAVVVDGGRVLNPGGLRMDDEFVCHKMLDAIGDLALAGRPLRARFRGHRTGHALHNRLLRALFADRSAWRESVRDEELVAA